MRLALQQGERGRGKTGPNPPVGAVIVRNGRMVGQGYHHKAGTPHAEVHALRQAGSRAAGSTLYVTLEPCCTQGRTPPCTDAIIRSGIKRVVVAVRDPYPPHRGRGLAILRRAGISVTEGVCKEEAALLLAPFAKHLASGMPYVSLKLAVSMDGKIADVAGRSRWITGKPARRIVRALRRKVDAVMVGSGTVKADNPTLVPRGAGSVRPYRVLVDSAGSIPPGARVFTDGMQSRTIVATTARCPARRSRLYERAGAQVWRIPSTGNGRVSLRHLLRRLDAEGILHVLCEGGGELGASLIRAGLVDEILLFMAPKVIGGRTAPGAVAGAGWPIKGCPQFRFVEVSRVGADVMLRAVPACDRGRRI